MRRSRCATGSECAEPAGLRATRLRGPLAASAGRRGRPARAAASAAAASSSTRPAAAPAASTLGHLDDPCAAAALEPRAGPRATASDRDWRSPWPRRRPTARSPARRRPPKIQAASPSAMPTGVGSPVAAGAGGAAGSSAALRAIASAGSAAVAPGRGRGALSLVAARGARTAHPRGSHLAAEAPGRAEAGRLGSQPHGLAPAARGFLAVGCAVGGFHLSPLGPIRWSRRANRPRRPRRRVRSASGEEVPAVSVLQVEDRVQRPVEVIGEAGRLRDALRRRRPR